MVAGYLFVVGMLVLVAPIWQERLHFALGDPSFSLRTYVLSIGLGVGVTLVAGLYPARAASRVTPLEALRPSMGKVTWRSTGKRVAWGGGLIALALLGLFSGHIGLISLGSVLFLAGLVMVGPALVHPISTVFGRMLGLIFAREGQLAQGNLVRQPGRAAVTASAMMIGLAIVLALTGLVTTLTSGIMGYVDTSLGADYLVMPQSVVLGGGNVGAGPQLAQALRDAPGVAAVTTLRVGTSRIAGVDVQLVGIDPLTFSQVSGLQFTAGDPGQAYGELGSGRALIANGLYAAQNGVEVGQELTLQTPEGPHTYRVAGIGVDYLNSKLATVYVSHANLAGDFYERNDTLLMVNQAGDADPATVRAALEEQVLGYPAFTLYTFDEWRQQLRGESNAKLAAMYLLLAVVAVPSLIALTNTLGINVLERTREIGVLRAVGATRRQVRRVILAESLLLSVAGVALGILAGLWLGYVFVAGLNMAGYASEYYFPYAGILLTVAVGLCFGVLAALIPARQAARMNVIAALRYE